jgi:type VI secretion system VasD/TssJ family lipoprotein
MFRADGIHGVEMAKPRGSTERRMMAIHNRYLLGLAISVCLFGCKTAPKPTEMCFNVQASQNLNSYNGQPHAVTLHVYPLSGRLGFQQAGIDELLRGASPPGVTGSPRIIAVSPGQTRRIEETFDQATISIGILADYYRGPYDPEGTRRAIIEAKCGRGSPTVVLTAKDILLN